MQCKIAVILGAALSAALSNPLRAQDEGPAPEAGKVLLLASERILEGDIERVGERYRIRRGTSEVWIPTVSAICLCANLDDAFAQMKKRANLGDPDERLRLARWCQLNGLREQALAEARYSLEMRPQHTATKSLIAALERTLNSAASAPAPSSPSKTAVTPPKSLTPIDVNADSLMQFTQKVQPILLNLCANCHGNGKGGDFQLYRSFEVGQRGATQRNLAAALAQVHMQKPAISPLLVKAVSAHGDSPNAPIRSQQSIPYRTLAKTGPR